MLRFALPPALLLAQMLAFAVLPAPAQEPHPSYAQNPKFQKEVAGATDPHEPAAFRVDHWKRANKLAGGACQQCLLQLAELDAHLGDLKAVLETTAELEGKATAPETRAAAEFVRGSALFHARHDQPKPEQLQEAATDFASSADNDPKLALAYYMSGRALALLHRDDEAHAQFLRFLAVAPATDDFRTRATHFAADPALARAHMAPPFTVTTADGKQFTLDDMGGRVVLVDFWATWCGPCNRELPHIRKIAQEFADQPFVLISVSWDSDPAKWSDFIAKNGMVWHQYRDADHTLSELYGVNAIPHYFTIDADGVLEAEQIGEGADLEGKLRRLLARAREEQQARPVLSASGKTLSQ